MTLSDLWPWVAAVLTSTGLGAGVAQILLQKGLDRSAERLKADLLRESQKEVERLKAELQLHSQQQVERLKAELQLHSQQQVEHLRSDLNARNEVMRHEMAKQMLRAQLSTTRTHDVYSTLIKLIREAEGAVVKLWGLRRDPTFEKHSREDIQRVLKEARAPGAEESEILDLLKEDRKEAIKRLEEVLRRVELFEARKAITEAKNHIILEGIFMTTAVRELAFKICGELGRAEVAVEVGTMDRASGKYTVEYNQLCRDAAADINQLEERMRADLLPGLIEHSTASPPPLSEKPSAVS